MITINGHNLDDISIDGVGVTKIQDAYTLEVMWEKTQQITDYFYIENKYNGSNTITINYMSQGSPPSGTYATSVQYSKDKSTWYTKNIKPSSGTISMDSGEKVYFRNNSGVWSYSSSNGVDVFRITISCNKSFDVGGDIMSLIDYTRNVTSLNYSRCFGGLFHSASYLVNASSLSLTPTTLSDGCYAFMFYNCTNLITTPSLPAMSMTNVCYQNMFQGCSSLTTAPALPSTSLATACYQGMFAGCSGLTTAPALPATSLVSDCYASMFNNCTSLTSTPSLPATTLQDYCYTSMFNGCTRLANVIIYANDISATDCLYNWLYRVSSSGTFHKLGSASFPTNSSSGIPSGWTVVNS